MVFTNEASKVILIIFLVSLELFFHEGVVIILFIFGWHHRYTREVSITSLYIYQTKREKMVINEGKKVNESIQEIRHSK